MKSEFLGKQEKEAFLEAYSQFFLFRDDGALFSVVYSVERWEAGQISFTSFGYGTSMGSSGTSSFGNPDFDVCVARFGTDVHLPRLYLRPRSLVERFLWLTEGDRSIEKPALSAAEGETIRQSDQR